MSSPPAVQADNLPAIHAGQAIDFRHLTPETTISLTSAGREYRLSAQDVIRWVAPQAPVSDAVKLLVIAQNTGLNPMLGEIELINFSGKWTPSIRKNGYVKIAQRSPDYDGHESGIVIQPKDRSRPPTDTAGTITPLGWLLVGGWCKVWRKGVSRPVYKRVALQDYDRNTGTWKTNAPVMIEKVAIAQAIREAFPVGETYDDAEGPEAPPIMVNASVQPPALAASPAANATLTSAAENFVLDAEVVEDEPEIERLTAGQAATIIELTQRLAMPRPDYLRMLAKRGVEQLSDLDRIQAREIIDRLEHIVSRQEWPPVAEQATAPATPSTAPAIEPETVVLPETTRPGGDTSTEAQ